MQLKAGSPCFSGDPFPGHNTKYQIITDVCLSAMTFQSYQTCPLISRIPRMHGNPTAAYSLWVDNRSAHSWLSTHQRDGCMRVGGSIWLGYFQKDSHGVHLMIGRLNLRELNQSDSEGPDISLVVIRTVLGRFTHHHFWSHPWRKQNKTVDSIKDTRNLLHGVWTGQKHRQGFSPVGRSNEGVSSL